MAIYIKLKTDTNILNLTSPKKTLAGVLNSVVTCDILAAGFKRSLTVIKYHSHMLKPTQSIV
jgi:hypothetical protein